MKIIESAGFLVKRGCQVLLGRPYSEKFWGFFKGKVEDGETRLQCAKRELLEETGLDYDILAANFPTIPKAPPFLGKYSFESGKKYKVVFIYLLDLPVDYDFEPVCRNVKPSGFKEIYEFHWFDLPKVEGAITYSQLRFFKRLLRDGKLK